MSGDRLLASDRLNRARGRDGSRKSALERGRACDLPGQALRRDEAVPGGYQLGDLFPVSSTIVQVDSDPTLGPHVGRHVEGLTLYQQGLPLGGVGLQPDRRPVLRRDAEHLAPAAADTERWVLPGFELECLREGEAESAHPVDQLHDRAYPGRRGHWKRGRRPGWTRRAARSRRRSSSLARSRSSLRPTSKNRRSRAPPSPSSTRPMVSTSPTTPLNRIP